MRRREIVRRPVAQGHGICDLRSGICEGEQRQRADPAGPAIEYLQPVDVAVVASDCRHEQPFCCLREDNLLSSSEWLRLLQARPREVFCSI